MKFEGVLTQINIGNSIPDMSLQGDDLRVIVEIKVSDWRGLTDNQPQAYLEWLKEEAANNKYFVFLTPPNYLQNLAQEYGIRKNNFCTQHPLHGIRFIEINWLDLCSALDESELPYICNYSRDFKKLLQSWYLPNPIKFSRHELLESDMFSVTAASSTTKLFRLIDLIASEIERAGFNVHRSFQKRWWDDGEYGIYINCQDTEVLFLGLWTRFWQDHGCPLCIGVHHGEWPNAISDRFQENFPDNIVYPPNEASQYLTKCIDPTFLTEDAVRDVTNWLLEGYLNEICATLNE